MDTSHGWASLRSAARYALAFSFAVALAGVCASCKTNPLDDPFVTLDEYAPRAGSVHGDATFSMRPLDPELLEDDGWIEKPPVSYAERSPTDRRWHHPALDPYLHARAPRTDLKEQLASTSPVVATNAAIVAAHWGTAAPIEHLTAAIRVDQLPLPLRCAAAEALGYVEKPSPAPALRGLLKQLTVVERRPEAGEEEPREGIPADLHADLIRALARHAEPGDETWFNAALASSAWQVRLEGVAAWAELVDLSLPPRATELIADRDSRVRAAAVRTIAAHRGPRTVTYLQRALNDPDFDVRMAATGALNDIGTADAKALLGGAKDRAAELRQRAVTASDSVGALRDSFEATVDDAQMNLRLAAAQTRDEVERRGRQLAAETSASTQEAVREATAQFGVVADATAEHVRDAQQDVQQLVATLADADLPQAARRRAATALERLATDADAAVRIRAAQAMGQLADPVYLPVLMAMLSDEAEVQSAALASLVAIAGTDVTAGHGENLSNRDKVRIWQFWYRERQNK